MCWSWLGRISWSSQANSWAVTGLLFHKFCACAGTSRHPCGCGFMARRGCISRSTASHTVLHDNAGLPARQRVWTCEAGQQRNAAAHLLCVLSCLCGTATRSACLGFTATLHVDSRAFSTGSREYDARHSAGSSRHARSRQTVDPLQWLHLPCLLVHWLNSRVPWLPQVLR